jgi:pyrimidine-specific ribonucleoside hydrolase
MSRLAAARRRNHGLGAALIAVVLSAGACGGTASPSPSAGPTPTPEPTQASGPIPLVIDTDMAGDDLMAIAYLTARSDVEIRAITVAGTGEVHCGPGERNVRSLLNELNRPIVPTSCGPETASGGGLVFPDAWRAAADDHYGVKMEGAGGITEGDAPALLTRTVMASDSPVTLLTLGPLTNVAAALASEPGLASRLSRIVVMGGAVDVSGNATTDGSAAPAEWNFAADPGAAAAVVAAGVPLTLVALDATSDVPLTEAFVAELRTDATAGPANLVLEYLSRNSFFIGVNSFWDQLAAVTLVDPSVVTLEPATIDVVTSGAEAGRTVRAADGAEVSLATAADAKAFETRYLEGLRSGDPRRSTFELAGAVTITYDGSTCATDVPPRLAAGVVLLTFKNDSGVDAAGALGLLAAGATIDDLDAWIAAHPGDTEGPEMVADSWGAFSPARSTGSSTFDIGAGNAFAVCLSLEAGKEFVVRDLTPFVVE